MLKYQIYQSGTMGTGTLVHSFGSKYLSPGPMSPSPLYNYDIEHQRRRVILTSAPLHFKNLKRTTWLQPTSLPWPVRGRR